jgi:hypothetical protein
MKPAASICGLFALAALAAVVKNEFQPLLGYLLLVSLAAAVIFYRAGGNGAKPGDLPNKSSE